MTPATNHQSPATLRIHIRVTVAHLLCQTLRLFDLDQPSLADAWAPTGRFPPLLFVVYQLRPERKDAALRGLRGMDGTTALPEEMALGTARNAQAARVFGPIHVPALEIGRGHSQKCRRANQVVLGQIDEALLLATGRTTWLALKPHTSYAIVISAGISAMTRTIHLTINGKKRTDSVEPRLLLIHYLRDVAGLTGPHIGCETSICGACTVNVDGKAVKSCAMFAVQADGREVLTIEGLASNGHLHPVQEAFWNEHGLQCGFCTPGMIMTATQLLSDNPNLSREEIRHGLEGNLCRCTGYMHIVNAVQSAGKKMAVRR